MKRSLALPAFVAAGLACLVALVPMRWLGELDHSLAMRWLARSHVMVISSVMEGGAHVLMEALLRFKADDHQIEVMGTGPLEGAMAAQLGSRCLGFQPLEVVLGKMDAYRLFQQLLSLKGL